MAKSDDLKTWQYQGRVDGGENACIIVQGGEYVMFHSTANGIGQKRSSDGMAWRDTSHFYLGQKDWPWAQGRLTAGYVMDARLVKGVERYLMVFHGEPDASSFTVNTNIGIAWSHDLDHWQWPIGV